MRVFVSDAQYHSREGGRVFGLAVLSICLHPRPFPKEGGMALNCLVLHQLTKALPSPPGLERSRVCSGLWGRRENEKWEEKAGENERRRVS